MYKMKNEKATLQELHCCIKVKKKKKRQTVLSVVLLIHFVFEITVHNISYLACSALLNYLLLRLQTAPWWQASHIFNWCPKSALCHTSSQVNINCMLKISSYMSEVTSRLSLSFFPHIF